MKTGKQGKRILATVLAMILALSAAGTAAAEDYKGRIVIYNGEVYPEGTPMKKDDAGVWTMTGNIEGPDEDHSYGLDVRSEAEWDWDPV